MSRALVLNASYEALCVVTSQRALVMVLNDKAELLHATENVFRSERYAFPEPSVVKLTHFVRVPFPSRIALSRRAIFARDNHRCQYCGAQAENVYHVVPRSRGGSHSWDNVVASCKNCNSRKEDRLLSETNFVLRSRPMAPRGRAWLIAIGSTQPDWLQYLQGAQSA